MKRSKKEIVVFRKDPDGTVFALFPYIEGSPGMCTCYQYVGQHSSADYTGCISSSRPAYPDDYAALLSELKQIGYNLNVRKKKPNPPTIYHPRRA